MPVTAPDLARFKVDGQHFVMLTAYDFQVAQILDETGVPVIFGVLATETIEQARARSGGTLGNRGEDAARAAIEMATLFRELSTGT